MLTYRNTAGSRNLANERPMISPEFVRMTRCLATHSPLHLAEDRMCQRINAKISQGRIRNRAGRPVENKVDAGLINQDGSLLYPILDDIPQLLLDEAIPLSQLSDAD